MTEKLLTEREVAGVLSCNIYWEEVSRRKNQSPLWRELDDLVERIGVKILFIVADYAKRQKEMEKK